MVLDGVRRTARPAVLDLRAPVILPTPLEVISQTPVEPHERIDYRPFAAFGLVAVALGLSGVMMTGSIQRFAQTVEARSASTPPPATSASALAAAPI